MRVSINNIKNYLPFGISNLGGSASSGSMGVSIMNFGLFLSLMQQLTLEVSST